MDVKHSKQKQAMLWGGLAACLLIAFYIFNSFSGSSGSPSEETANDTLVGTLTVENEGIPEELGEVLGQLSPEAKGEDPMSSQMLTEQDGPSLLPDDFPFAASFEDHQEWIIKWKAGYEKPEGARFDTLDVDDKRQIMLVRLHDGVQATTWYRTWVDRDDIEYVRPNQRVEIKQKAQGTKTPVEISQSGETGLANDLGWPEYLDQINAPEGWQIADRNDDVVIAVLDTGIDLHHPLLEPFIVDGAYMIFDYDAEAEGRSQNERLPQDDNGHGTRVAGVIVAADNQWGYRGLLRSVKLMPVKVIEADGAGSEFDVAQGIYYAVDHGADIVLLSAGFPFNSENMRDAVTYADEHGVLVIAATGNSEAQDIARQVSYPAAYPSVLAVGAVDGKDEPASYSNQGPEVGVVAPGSVYTTDIGGGFTYDSGTSFAAPQVAGLAALIMKQFPELSIAEVRNHIYYTAQDVGPEGWDQFTGHGRIDVGRALSTDPVKDIFKENQSIEQAAPLPIDSFLSAELRNKEDRHYYYVETPYRGTLQLDLNLAVGKYEGVNLTFYPLGQEEKVQVFTIQKQEEIRIEVPAGTSYFQIAYHHNERRTTPLPYEVTQTFHIYKDPQHPNHSYADAFAVQNGEVIIGTFHEAGLKDWYYFDVPEEGTMQVSITMYTNRSDPVLEVIRPTGERIERDINDPPWQEELILDVEPGRYHIVVSDWYNNQVNEEYYLAVVYLPRDVHSLF